MKGLYQKLVACFVLLMLAWPLSAQASELLQLTLLDSDDGDVLRIEGDSALEYQVFDLDGPPRLLLSFPSATLSKNIQAIKASGQGVLSVKPVVVNHGVRIEIALSKVLKYNIEEKNHHLLIRFEGVKRTASNANVHHAAMIKDLEVRDQGGVTELHLRGEYMNANHNAFVSDGGKQLILDFWGGKAELSKEFYQFAAEHIRSVTVGHADGRVRFVVALSGGTEMQQQIDANTHELVVRLGSIVAKKKTGVIEVENVEFRPDDRVAHLMIRTSQTNPIMDVQEKDDKVIILVKKANLLRGQERTQDVSAFPGPIKQIDSYQDGKIVKIVARLRQKVSVTTFQQGNIFTLNFEPEDMVLARMSKGQKQDPAFAYTGQKVTFDFKDIDIRNALKLISEMSDLNIIMSDDVTGTLTMRLVDVPWDQALDLILSARGLGQEKVGNVMRIAPMEVLRAQYASKLETREGSLKLEPLITEFITPSFAKVGDIKKILNSSKAKAGGTGTKGNATSSGLMTKRGSLMMDIRTNTLIVKDTRKAIDAIKRLITKIDRPIKQVQIEARIVEASDLFQRNLGIRWGGNGVKNTNQVFPNRVAIGGTQLAAGATGGNGILVDLPVATAGTGGSIGLALGSFNNLINLNLELSAAELDGDVHIVSNPRIVTTNLKSATIKQGIQLAYVTPGSANNPPTTTFKDALLELTVTPQITADNSVLLEVLVKKDAPSATGNGIDKKEITTNILMKNGETIVIGGVYTRIKRDSTNGVPWLSKIPVLGWLFKNNSKQDDKTELLIFLTPKILNVEGDK
ncbi:MAG: type IV pilus secretin PilQ [Zetaproteobacteria bacterium]|nr:type IV pilus secretin PilQ [Zetaproteobacteria bacterium]